MKRSERIAFNVFATALILTLGTAVLSLCAEICHSRYSQHSDDAASFPCRDDHDRAYFHALRWLLHCKIKQCTTWIIKESRLASFTTPPHLFPWTRTICFGVAESNRFIVIKGWKHEPASLKIQFCAQAPASDELELCVFGSLQNVLRKKSQSDFKMQTIKLPCSRRNVLDFFRYPFRRADDIWVTFASDDEKVLGTD